MAGGGITNGMSVWKISWVETGRESEADIIERAREALDDMTDVVVTEEQELLQLYGLKNRKLSSCLPSVYWWRDLKEITAGSRTGLFLKTCKDHDVVQRMIVIEPLSPIYLLDDLEDYKEAIRYVVLGIHFLATSEHKIMHRDISRQNLMFRRVNGSVNGVLIDFDLASTRESMLKSHKSVRPGTRPFMAVSLHLGRGQNEIPEHRERFDLESIFYVMYWDAQFFDKGRKVVLPGSAAQNSYNDWITYNDETAIAVKKDAFIRPIPDITEFFEPLEDIWLYSLGFMFYTGYNELDDQRSTLRRRRKDRLVKDWEIEGFDYDTLGGKVTFERVWEILRK